MCRVTGPVWSLNQYGKKLELGSGKLGQSSRRRSQLSLVAIQNPIGETENFVSPVPRMTGEAPPGIV